MTVAFECTTRSTIPQQTLFDLSRSVDVHTQSMSRSRERAIAGVTAGLMSEGEDVTWRAWHFGVPLRMTSRITTMEAPHQFIDEQLHGPFRSFRHVHGFSEDAGMTTMVDRVEFAAPFGPLGRLVERLILARYMRKLIETRNSHLVAGQTG